MSKYAETKDVKVTIPIGLYNEMIAIVKSPNTRWNYPQNFIISAIEEKIERWKSENYGGPLRTTNEKKVNEK